jgi:hypothetical protein
MSLLAEIRPHKIVDLRSLQHIHLEEGSSQTGRACVGCEPVVIGALENLRELEDFHWLLPPADRPDPSGLPGLSEK